MPAVQEVAVTDRGITDEVVAAAQQGDVRAFRVVYDNLAGAVLGYLRAKGVADPEAVTSDVFLTVWPKLGAVTGGAAGLRKLVFAIAHARMVDEYRARSRRPMAAEYEPETDTRTVASAEEDAQIALGTARVIETLAILPDEQREVLTLRIVADLPLDHVAEIVGKSVGAVKQLQRRALITIRQAIEERRVTL
jgi:RNA polymerase sigma factor (sigma-70 family)